MIAYWFKRRFLLSCLMLCFSLLIIPAYAGTYTVSNTSDENTEGSLRYAINSLNSSGVEGTIEFAFGAAGTITLSSELPDLLHSTTFNLSDYDVTLEGQEKYGLTLGDTVDIRIDDGNGTLTLSGCNWTGSSTTDVSVGLGRTGKLTISNGGTLSDIRGWIGRNSDSVGSVIVTGAGSTWTNDLNLYVGHFGVGELTISNGGTVSNDDIGYIGLDTKDSTGIVTVTGAGSTWTNGSNLYLGYVGTGELSISNGGIVTIGGHVFSAYYNPGSSGTVTVTGAGSTLECNNFEVHRGSGVLNISDGGKAEVAQLRIAMMPLSTGTVTVTGAGSVLTASSCMVAINNLASATLTVSDGATVTIDNGAGSIILAMVSGSNGKIYIGEDGKTAGTINASAINGGAGTAEVYFSFDSGISTLDAVLSGTLSVYQEGEGTTILSGASTYTGATTIDAGNLCITGSTTSATTVDSGGILSGTGTINDTVSVNSGGGISPGNSSIDTLTVDTLAMNSGSTLYISADSASSYDQLSISGLSGSSVDTGSVVYVDVDSAKTITDETQFLVIGCDEGAMDTKGIVTATSASSYYTFTPDWETFDSDWGLVLTSQANTYAGRADNSNSSAAGAVLDNIREQGSSGDMQTVLAALDASSGNEVTSSLNTMAPTVDSGVLDNSNAALNNFVGASLNRIQDVFISASSENSPASGISCGDESGLKAIWAKGCGSYLDQGTRRGIQGYDAWNSGMVFGMDRMLSDAFTVGVSGGYAYGRVDADNELSETEIHSTQGSLYAGHQSENTPYFINAVASFAWNWYNGKRDINIGAAKRTAKSDYCGQQYSLYLDGGYSFSVWDNLKLTPLTSIQWNHLRLAGYTETGANALNLDVNSQDYDLLQYGLGAGISTSSDCECGALSSEIHAKWLYNFVNDAMAVTSSYTGGGGSFDSYGVKPARSGVNIGGKLSFDFKNNVSLVAECDTELRNEFFGVYGSATLRYRF